MIDPRHCACGAVPCGRGSYSARPASGPASASHSQPVAPSIIRRHGRCAQPASAGQAPASPTKPSAGATAETAHSVPDAGSRTIGMSAASADQRGDAGGALDGGATQM